MTFCPQFLNLELILNISENSDYIFYRKVGLKDKKLRHQVPGCIHGDGALTATSLVVLCPSAAVSILRPKSPSVFHWLISTQMGGGGET